MTVSNEGPIPYSTYINSTYYINSEFSGKENVEISDITPVEYIPITHTTKHTLMDQLISDNGKNLNDDQNNVDYFLHEESYFHIMPNCIEELIDKLFLSFKFLMTNLVLKKERCYCYLLPAIIIDLFLICFSILIFLLISIVYLTVIVFTFIGCLLTCGIPYCIFHYYKSGQSYVQVYDEISSKSSIDI